VTRSPSPRRPWLRRASSAITSPPGLLLLIGLLLREGFAFWTGHPYDLEVWIRTGAVVARGTNPYLGAWPAVPGVSFGYTNQLLYPAAYLPFWPDVFGGTFWVWEHSGTSRFVLYLLLKQGPIAGDLAVAVLLYRLVARHTGDTTRATAALAFWAFFPYDIVISAIWGQLDSVTTAIVLASLLLSEAQAAQRSLLWGLGIFVKWITVVFLPLEFFRNRGWARLWPAVGVLLTGALTLLAFLAAGWSFSGIAATTTSSTAGGGGGMNWVQLVNLWFLLRFVDAHPWIYTWGARLWVPAAIATGWYAARWVRAGAEGAALRALLLILAVTFLLRWGLYEQYMLYVFALLVADVYTLHPGRRQFLYFMVGLASAFLLINNGFGIWFATPVTEQAFVVVQRFDSSAFWGNVRYYTMDVLAVAMTITLVQLALVLVRDEATPWPWLLPRWPRTLGSRPTSEPGPDAPSPG
jgi:hypothetical protein